MTRRNYNQRKIKFLVEKRLKIVEIKIVTLKLRKF